MADQGEASVDVSALKGALDTLPEEEKNGNKGKIINYIVELFQGGWTLRQAAKNIGDLSTLGRHLEKIEKILDKLTEDGKKAIIEALEFQKQNCTDAMRDHFYDTCSVSLDDLYDSVAADRCSEHDKTKTMILDTIRSFHREESNKVITDMVKGSAAVAAFQAVKIYIAWKHISEANNVIKDPNKFTQINKNIERMENMVTEFIDLCERDSCDRKLDRKMVKINTLFTSTLAKISDLKVNINGNIQRLDLLADFSVVDGVVNSVTAASQAYQVWHAWQNLTSFTKVIGVASVVVFAGLAAGNAKIFFLSREKIAELRKDLNEAVRLQEALQDLHDQASGAFESLEE